MGGQERSYGGRSAAERATERRARLVGAAVDVLARAGESGATMTAICAEAGLTERYFYESFRSRDEALVAALDAVADEISAAALAALATAPATGAVDPRNRVRAAIAAVVDLVGDSPDKGRVALVESTGNAGLRARRHELLSRFADLVGDEAQHIFGDTAWPPARARLHGLLFAAGFAEVLASWLSGELDLDRGELVDLGTDLIQAVQRRPAPPHT